MKNNDIFVDNDARLRHCSLFTVRCSLPRGMTLIELLVGVSIMVMLVAISVPMFKPMLESQKAAGGARTVALALQRARIKAMESGIPHGIEFQRFSSGGTASTTTPALQMYLVSGGKPATGIIGSVGTNGGLTGGDVDTWTTTGSAGVNVQPNDKIQLNYQGKYYVIGAVGVDGSGNGTGQLQMNGTAFPAALANVPYKLVRQARSETKKLSLIPPMTMPRGTIVDLRYSGFDYPNSSGDYFDSINPKVNGYTGVPPAPQGHSVVVMFAPNGTVDGVSYVRYEYNDTTLTWAYNVYTDRTDTMKGAAKLIYFCVGEWDRQVDISDYTLAEDGRGNLPTASNFWVTINPRNGEVRTVEMTYCETEYANWRNSKANGDPPDVIEQNFRIMIAEARKYARERFVNIGEQ